MITMKQTIEVNQNAMRIRDLLLPVRDEQERDRQAKAIVLGEAYETWFQLRNSQPENAKVLEEANDNVHWAYVAYSMSTDKYNATQDRLSSLSSIDCFIEDAPKTIDTPSGSVL